ncbi:zinc ribbon domain-containing protein [Microcoleus sp. Pol11C3]|uniref:zinc ribbon domain-containing protein n=1 Tax=Microcoleus sp. Pol11C3 TaxID=3055390 RepID=UPI002FD5757C
MQRGLSSVVGLSIWGSVVGWYSLCHHPTTLPQNCSNCGEVVKKSLSTRTHTCYRCGHTQDRDWNAAGNILQKALSTVGHIGINV